jgi:hypothetical protein
MARSVAPSQQPRDPRSRSPACRQFRPIQCSSLNASRLLAIGDGISEAIRPRRLRTVGVRSPDRNARAQLLHHRRIGQRFERRSDRRAQRCERALQQAACLARAAIWVGGDLLPVLPAHVRLPRSDRSRQPQRKTRSPRLDVVRYGSVCSHVRLWST